MKKELTSDITPVPAMRDDTVLFMCKGYGYVTPNGVVFDKERPYQLVKLNEVTELLSTGRFELADKDSVKNFYGIIT